MDSNTKKLQDMIQRMIELDGSDQGTKQLNEAVSITGDTGEEVASLLKSLQHNAGMDNTATQAAPTMPVRQDMERLAGIIGDPEPEPMMADGESIEEMSTGSSKEVEQLLGLVRQVAKGDRRAQSKFKDIVSSEFADVDAGRFLQKLSKMDSRKQAETIEDLVKRGQRQAVSKSSASMKEPTFEDDDALVSSCCGAAMDNVNDGFGRCTSCGEMASAEYESEFEGYDNEPDADYQDTDYMTKDLSGGLNRQKKSYADAEDGDNPMAVESIKDRLYARLSEKKEKPDFADIDGDGDKKEPMKKAAKDKKKDKK